MKSIFLKSLLLLLLLNTNSFSKEWDFLAINGYGSLGVAYQNNEEVLYRNSFQTKRGSQGDVSFLNYSNLGLQIDAHATPNLTFTLQGVLSDNNSAEGLFELGWANVSYRLNDNITIKVGKMRLAAFMDSDILNVGYSYDMVKLPTMYKSIPFQSYRGIEMSHQVDFDDIVLFSTIFYGQSTSHIYNNYLDKADVNLDNMKGIMFKLVKDRLTLRIAYNKNDLTVDNRTTNNALNQLSTINVPIINQTLDKYDIKEISYLALGAEYEWDNAYIKGEYIDLNTDSFLADMHSWYINIGYEFENWSPYILYSKTNSKSAFKGIPSESTMPTVLIEAINATNEGLQYVSDASAVNSEVSSLGFRYNLTENSVFKFQYDYLKENSFINKNRQEPMNVDIHVFSSALSFVF